MPTIRIKYEEMRALANDFQRQSEQIQQILSTLNNRTQQLVAGGGLGRIGGRGRIVAIEYPELHAIASDFQNQSQQIQQVVSTLNNRAEQLLAGWEGVAELVFMQELQSCQQRLAKAPETLAQISLELRVAADSTRLAETGPGGGGTSWTKHSFMYELQSCQQRLAKVPEILAQISRALEKTATTIEPAEQQARAAIDITIDADFEGEQDSTLIEDRDSPEDKESAERIAQAVAEMERRRREEDRRPMPMTRRVLPWPFSLSVVQPVGSRAARAGDKRQVMVSVAHPRLLSKRFSSPFLVQLYLPDGRDQVARQIEGAFDDREVEELIRHSKLTLGQRVQLKLFSHDIDFSDPVVKEIEPHTVAHFTAKPRDGCEPGLQQAILSVCDPETHVELDSVAFAVRVTDFAFDHISRPLLSQSLAAVTGAGSLIMFTLTLLGQIDATLGVASGTAAAAVTAAIYAGLISQFQRIRLNVP